MKVQDETFDLCNDCFRHLAVQIDKVFEEVKKLTSQPSKLFAAPPEGGLSKLNAGEDVGELLTPKEHTECVTEDVLKDLQLLSMEQMVSRLEASLQKLDSFADDAKEMVHRWSELPVNLGRARERDTDGSGGAAGLKADVFWAHYMDRDNSGTKRRPVRGGALRGRRTLRAQKKRDSEEGCSSIVLDSEEGCSSIVL